ncbi:Fic family protein [Candidatus Marithrix sp. Canyon 246]|uniref:Fic family protein n=2 Tax=Candidatus Marithrix sp. Canyon 246 TaxID=1827136 RepID=UPI0009F66920|nr:Fic family protein [Candidatus Marithrix sp. Canyon 246]
MMSYQPPYRITTKITHFLTNIAEILGEIKYIDSKLNTPKLRKINKIKTITGTLQIEGNSFSEQKVSAVLEGKRVLSTPKELAEVQGAIAVYEQFPHYDCYNIDHLLKAHQLMMGQILTRAGHFRTQSVGVYGKEGVTHIAPPANMVSGLMAELFDWLQQSAEHPLISSSIFHYEFEFIHPFIDGNGRMGRLWQTLILNNWKPLFQTIPVESVIRDYQQDYYHALQQSGNDGESTVFIEFMLQVILESIQQVTESI